MRATHAAFAVLAVTVAAQVDAQPPRGQLVNITVHGPSIERNMVGLSADRDVAVYLPPSYARSNKRYPVVYVLHGIMDTPRAWTEAWGPPYPPNPGFATLQDLMDRGIASGALQEMILVIPDADKSCHYTDSPVKGGWASFVAKDLVQYIDRSYRTSADAGGRGILGHSMGGHGALKIAMEFGGVFSSVYAMNPSMLGWGGDLSVNNPQLADLAKVRSPADIANVNFYAQAVVGVGQCFSPNANAPLLTDFPFTNEGGAVRTTPAEARWTAQMPVYMAPSHAKELNALRGLMFDSAFEDEYSHIPISSRALHAVLDSLGVKHTFELYNGDHRNRLWGEKGRLNTIALPFFSRLLTATQTAAPQAIAAPPPAQPTAKPATREVQEKLWSAARSGDVKRATEALRDGADVNALDTLTDESGGAKSGRRALNYAATHNQARMIAFLVERGAEVNRPNVSGFTPLHHAAEKGAVNAAEELLKQGADPNAKLPSGSTPLRVAQQRQFANVVKLLEKVTGR